VCCEACLATTPNYLFSINKVRINGLVISHLFEFTTIFFPCHHSFGYSLSHQSSYFRWSTRGTVSPPTMLKTMGKATTKKPTRLHPLRLLLSKCWLCKHRCFRPCSRSWSTCMHNPKRHHHRGIGSEIFSVLSRQPFLILWTRWMLMIGSNMLRRSCKWYNTTIVRWCR
jgi:hypothetical protein